MFPDYTYSSESDAEDHGLEREQPDTEAILSNYMPACPRYFRSCCRDVRVDWCPMLKLRYLFCEWNHVKDVAYATRCWEGSRDYIQVYSRGYPA